MDLLAKALTVMLDSLQLDSSMYIFHRPRRGGTTAAYRVGIYQLDINGHGLWASNTFWGYITAPYMADSPISTALSAPWQPLCPPSCTPYTYVCKTFLHLMSCMSSGYL